MSEATVLLAAVEQGDSKAGAELLELVYDELRRLASAKMAQQAPGQTLQPTALVHEAWLRLVGAKNPKFRNSTHFFAAAAEAMRRILIDRATGQTSNPKYFAGGDCTNGGREVVDAVADGKRAGIGIVAWLQDKHVQA